MGDFFGTIDESHTVNSGVTMSGDDAIELFLNGVVVDLYGDINVDGTGSDWEYKDSWASRNCDVQIPNPSFDISEWQIAPNDCSDGSFSNAESRCPFPLAGCGPCAESGIILRLARNEGFCPGYAPADWHETIDQSGYDANAVCEVVADTDGGTCRDWCAARGASCYHAQDNSGSGCTLNPDHTRGDRSTDNNGCDQGWNGQICGCGRYGPGAADYVDPNDLVTNALMIKGVIDLSVPEGGSSGRMIELVAVTDIPDLSTFGVGIANNGGGSDQQEIDLPTTPLKAGEAFFLLRDAAAAASYFGGIFGEATEHHLMSGSDISVTGDDAVELFEFGQLIDVYASPARPCTACV